MSINRVTISGNLARDAELRLTASRLAVLGFGVAVNDRRKNAQTGEWEDCPNFIDCTYSGPAPKACRTILQRVRRSPSRASSVGASGSATGRSAARSKW